MQASELSETERPKLESDDLGENGRCMVQRPIVQREVDWAIELVISEPPQPDRLSLDDYGLSTV